MKSAIYHTFLILLISAVLSSCAYYSLTTEEFIKQAAQDQSKRTGQVFVFAYPIFFTNSYDANNLDKILCRDKNGKMVYLIPDQNTQWEFIKKDGESVKIYFETMILKDSTISGLRSRILLTRNVVHVSDIQEIKIYAEFPKTTEFKPEQINK
jgi:hypothetical protein